MADDDNFLSRWSRRKAQVRQGVEPPARASAQAPTAAATLPQAPAAAAPGPVETAAAAAPGRPQAEIDLPAAVPSSDALPSADAERSPPPTLDDVALLDRESSYSRFVTPDVPAEVKNAALKKLFTDPHFNVMDGLDTYIEDYGQPDPLPASMLRQMASAHALGLFRDDSVPGVNAPRAAGSIAAAEEGPCELVDAQEQPPVVASDAEALPPPEPAHEDTDLRLQPNDAAGCPGAEPGAGKDAGRQH